MAISRVQYKTASNGGTAGMSQTVVLDSTPTAGNIIVVAVAAGGVILVSGTNIEVMQYLCVQGASTTNATIAICKVLSSPSATITVTTSTSIGIAIVAAEYSGATTKFDVQSAATATTTSLASGAAPTSATANQLWVGVLAQRGIVGSEGVFSSPTNSGSIVAQVATSMGTTAGRSCGLWERIVSATGTPNAGATSTNSAIWVAGVIAIEEAPAASTSGGSHCFIG